MPDRAMDIDRFTDYLNHTLPDFHNRKQIRFFDDLTNYVVVDELFKQNRAEFEGGESIEERVQFGSSKTSRLVGPFESLQYDYSDDVQIMKIGYSHRNDTMAWDQKLLDANASDKQIVRLRDKEYLNAKSSHINAIEQDAFRVPASASDTKTPNGFPYWVSPLAEGVIDYDGGFNGLTTPYQDGSSPTTVGNLSPSLYKRWRNWAGTHKGYIDPTLLDSMLRALNHMEWKLASNVQQYAVRVTGTTKRVYSSIDLKSQYDSYVNQGSDNRNGDAFPTMAKGIAGVPWVGMGVLGTATRSPIYMLDLDKCKPIVRSGRFMQLSEITKDNNNKHITKGQLDTTYNFVCFDRSCQAVFATAA